MRTIASTSRNPAKTAARDQFIGEAFYVDEDVWKVLRKRLVAWESTYGGDRPEQHAAVELVRKEIDDARSAPF